MPFLSKNRGEKFQRLFAAISAASTVRDLHSFSVEASPETGGDGSGEF
jgi:hypothetical protein